MSLHKSEQVNMPLMQPGLVPLWKILCVCGIFILQLIFGMVAFISDITWLSGTIEMDTIVDAGRNLILLFGSAKLSVSAADPDTYISGFSSVLIDLGDQCDAAIDQPAGVCQDVLAWRFACDIMLACGLTSLAIWIMAMVVTCCAHNYTA